MDPLPIEHVLIHVRDTLASDGRVGELGLDVDVEDDVVVIRGAISTISRRDGVVAVVLEVLDAYGSALTVRNDTTIPDAAAPDREPERL